MSLYLTNHDFDAHADPSGADPNRYHGELLRDPLDGGEFTHLLGCRAWSMVDAYLTLEGGEPCTVCGHVRGGPTIRRSARRRGLIHCLQCNAASTDGRVDYHGEPPGTRWNPGWEPETPEVVKAPPLRKFLARGSKTAG